MIQSTNTLLFALGLGAGATLMFFADPRLGRRRRALVRDQAVSLANDARKYAGKTARDLSNRASGMAHEGAAAVKGQA